MDDSTSSAGASDSLQARMAAATLGEEKGGCTEEPAAATTTALVPAPALGAAAAAAAAAVTSASAGRDPARLRKKVVWECDICQRACFPVRTESRCLCGHRYRQHPAGTTGDFGCAEKGCKCRGFFYIFAEGAFILRCRCKHKAQEHEPGAAPYACARAGCKCAAFDSPWVCNCDHGWANHTQRVVEVDLDAPLPSSSGGIGASEFQVLRTDLSVPLPRYGDGTGGGVRR